MPALATGNVAPGFTLATTAGKKVSLHEFLRRGPVVLAFFKVSCPVCQFAFPLYERLAQAHKNSSAMFLGISQNNPVQASAFAREYGVTFSIAIDDEANGYTASNAYGLTNVPTLFYIDSSGEIEVSSVGWSKAEVDEVSAKLAELRHTQPPELWRTGEDVPAFRAG
ncbi:MAG TPA: TlpA disulfide reductase family protein [Candidatus Angelobacter sp.]|nr:TlpA disulfide reductase family protein [Candidatus Angelobacter sp.]